MSEFNENPFAKDTAVRPFSNGTDAEVWYINNCESCLDKEKCPMHEHIESGFILGEIPLWSAKDIGCKYDALYGNVHLNNSCNKYNDGTMPF